MTFDFSFGADSKPKGKAPFIILSDNTIRAPFGADPEIDSMGHPNKRKRMDESTDEKKKKEDEPVSKPLPQPPAIAAVRDKVYYFEDDMSDMVVVQVNLTLFKIHRKVLDSWVWLLDHVNYYEKVEGPTREDKAFSVSGYATLTEDQFRAFLWANYTDPEVVSLPADLQDGEFIQRLLRIVAIGKTNPGMPMLEKWAKDALEKAVFNQVFMDSCSSSILTMLLGHFTVRHANRPREVLLDNWVKRLWGNRGGSVAPTVPAILASHVHEIPRLRGVSCYVHLRDDMDIDDPNSEQGGFGPHSAIHLKFDTKLPDHNKAWLLHGSISLTALSRRLRFKPVPVPMSTSCSQEAHSNCVKVWESRWIATAKRERITDLKSIEIFKLVEILRELLNNDDGLKKMNIDCRTAGLDELKKLRVTLEDELHLHFMNPV